ncbi:hypothetical protein [Thiohalobacter sp.]|uniref:hypothetical protein n=1 Tax=Thiohalobacter sp. TaxID=2025948 RepID=UPI00260D3C0F|nr:hypothetical protein [Thiohalobacter sp.]
MNKPGPLPALLLAALLAGCNTLPTGGGLPAAARAELERAAAALGDAPDENARDRFVARVLARSERLERAGRLADALALVDAARQRLPDLRFDERADALGLKQAAALRRQSHAERLSAIRTRLQQRALLQARARIAPLDLRRRLSLQRLEAQLGEDQAWLATCAGGGDAAARDCKALLDDLNPARARAAPAERRPVPPARPPAKPAAEEDTAQKIRRLHQTLQAQMKQGDLRAARNTVGRLINLQGARPGLVDLRAAIDRAIDARVGELMAQAEDAYRRQQFQRARDNWKAVLALDPRHEKARELLERVETVIRNLESLEREEPRERATPE